VITCKGKSEILKMERAARIVHEALAECVAACRPGVTTEEIDRIAAQGIASRGGKAAFPGYRGYPKTICISINDEVVHGIPSATRALKAGDVVGLDLGAIVDGYYGDAARSVAVGPVSEAVKARRDDARGAAGRHRGRARRGPDRGHRRGRRGRREAEEVRRRARVRRARHRDGPPRGAAGPELRPGRQARGHPRGDDPRDRAHVQPRRRGRHDGPGRVDRAHEGPAAVGPLRAHVVATARGPVVLGFGRYAADAILAGAPGAHEYPLPVAVQA
jgi:cell division ATPase FtsA